MAWWVGPVNELMAAGARRGRGGPESSFRVLQARATARTGLPEEADPQFLADLQVLHDSFLSVPELSLPGHLDALLRVFPDATIVWPHRDMPTALASWCSLAEVPMRLSNRRVDLHQLGQDWTQMWAQAMTRALHIRAAAAQPFLDLSYTQLARAPLPALKALFSCLGAELTPAARQQITHRARHAGPAGPPPHHYSLDRYGLTPQAIGDAFQGIAVPAA